MRSRPLLTAALGVTALAAVAAAPMLPSTAAPAAAEATDLETPEEPPETTTETTTADARVVVAPVDTGINPYHEFFAVEQPAVTEAVLDEFRTELPEDNDLRTISLGDGYLADVAAGKYDDVAAGDLAWFEGTNIIARSSITVDGRPTPDGPRPFLPDPGQSPHGVGVTASVVTGNSEAIVYFVEDFANEYDAFTHPAVDIITTSYGFATAAPLPLEGSHEGVVELGKLHAGASTNDPSLAPVDGTSGPWWVLGVAGFEEHSSEGKQVFSGTFPDVTADFTQDLPYCDVCTEGTREVGGTSFATPLTAGVTSRVLLELRREAGHVGGITANENGQMVMVDRADGVDVTTWDLRRAMELGAYVPGFQVGPDNATDFVASAPVNPVLPAAQVGWGVVTPDPDHEVVTNALTYLRDGTETEKPQGTCDFMTGVMTFRYATWDAYPTSPTFGQDSASDSPYVAC